MSAPSPRWSSSAALEGAVELLERSLAYTRLALADIRPEHLGAPTPCVGWTLERLLAHMEDALDAFAEAAAGRVRVDPVPPTASRVDALREKACALLGAWTAARPAGEAEEYVEVGDLGLDAPLLVVTAALEIALHGWDVGQATGHGRRIPPDLAAGLLGIAGAVIDARDRGPRFGPPHAVDATAPADVRLLAWVGRGPRAVPVWPFGQASAPPNGQDPGQRTEPPPGNREEPRTRRGLAS
ncbi:TIGR03086 family protein [Nocardioides anomalus]|uniref:TIGR03086 family protein n=1 Tax=Nocardioides anomalus TaxID=2712223 RepID=A0A6G6WIQ4_9ACTN|nr:TIGR03086 family metal-binding protein [Nocardioides anomalus]QIG45124.1 TIGR03086 family protein [Nocardioides anomalus]